MTERRYIIVTCYTTLNLLYFATIIIQHRKISSTILQVQLPNGKWGWRYDYYCPAQGCSKKDSKSKWGIDAHIREVSICFVFKTII